MDTVVIQMDLEMQEVARAVGAGVAVEVVEKEASKSSSQNQFDYHPMTK